ncbi:MAG: PD-(D/E)XK nuclease family protein [Rikenellaceae bacterium]
MTFLDEVATRLYGEYGDGISQVKMIFPSRRARLFFVDALSRIAERPLWQPRWVTVDDLMSSAAGIEVGDRVRLIAELYKVYSKYHDEAFDKFYFWGEILLSDFDLVDKYLIDADMLFRNVSDIKELEADISYLTPEQLKIVAFWSSLGEDADLSREKRRFLKIWRSLASIYREYREQLQQLGIAYTGMIHRRAVEQIKSAEVSMFEGYGDCVVVGFNALSECEQRLFKAMSAQTNVEFFWDYDRYYTTNREQEAGLFLRDNILRHPEAQGVTHDHLSSPKNMEVIATASNALQCKYVAQIIKQVEARGERIDKNTAIVLTDENLLLPLLYALPQSVGKVNVTMGYPLRETLAYSFVERLIELQHHARESRSRGVVQFYHVDVVGLLSHPYVVGEDNIKAIEGIKKEISERRLISVDGDILTAGGGLLSEIFAKCRDWRELSNYIVGIIRAVVVRNYEGEDREQRTEYLEYIASHITTLQNSIAECEIEISTPIYISLLRRHLQTLRIPFEGEPLEGIQVMGILETRNLDFRNVIILSMNDDNFPGNLMSKPSFVPYNLRSAYGLPTPEHHEGVYAYYFYRLIQRAQNVWMLYSSHADEKSTGEPSRYIYQLDYESHFKLNRTSVGVDVNMIDSDAIEVAKEGRVAEQLSKFLNSETPITLSATALYRYVACPLRFYFYSLAKIRRDEELAEGVDAPMFGTILHDAVEKLYTPLIGVATTSVGDALRLATSGDKVERLVEGAINENYLQSKGAQTTDYTGNLLLVKEIVAKYIKGGIVAYDLAHPDFEVVGVEMKVDEWFEIEGVAERVKFHGVLDRVDRLSDGTLRIVDYKTGTKHLDFKGVEALFTGNGLERMSNTIQTLLYSMMLSRKEPAATITPALYYVRNMNQEDYSPSLVECRDRQRSEVVSYAHYRDQFESHLSAVLRELFDPNTPFYQCEDRKNTCSYCDYNSICKRQE